jgi:RHS repeat-associated protein
VRARNLITAVAAFLLFASLAFVTVTLTKPPNPAVPVQQGGTAAGFPRRAAASTDVGRIVNGKFVSETAAEGRSTAGPVAESSARVPGAVPPATRPKPIKFPDRGKSAPEDVQVLKPQPLPAKTGYNPKTSRELPLTKANQVTYANADGTQTALEYASPVNFKRANGTWAPISTSLVRAGGPASAKPSATDPTAGSLDAWVETREETAATPIASPVPTSSGQDGSSAPSPSASASTYPAASAPASATPSAPPAGPQTSTSGWTEDSEAEPESFAASGSASDLVTVPVDGGQRVAFGIGGANAVSGSASGNTVTYAGVRDDSSAVFSAGTGLVKESIVLSSPSAPSTWVFPLSLTGLKAKMGPGGIVEFVDSAGEVRAYVPRGFMTDSKIDPRSGDGARSFGVTYSLVTEGGQQAIRMTLDTAWLDSKDRVYPVTVDPSIDDADTNGSTYVLSPYDNDNSGDTELEVGTYDGGSNVAKSYLDFSGVASSLKNDNVLGAYLNLYSTWSYSCSARPVYVYPITSSWSVTGDKSSGPSTGSSVGSASFAGGWVPLGSTTSPCPTHWHDIGLSQAGTNLLNGWTHGTTADNGLALGASSSDSYGWKQFWSDSSSTGSPFLAITYTQDGATYKLASQTAVTNVTPNSAGTVAVRVKNTGASTWTPSNGYEMSYTACPANDNCNANPSDLVANHPVFTAVPSSVAPGQSVTVDVKVNALAAGNYKIIYSMYSGATGGSPVSFTSQGIQDLQTGLTVPNPPPVVADVYPPTGFVSSTLQQQLSTSATGDGTITYDFTLTCEPLPGQTCTDSSVSSGSISKSYWTPPAADLDWNMSYEWQVAVTSTSGSSKSTTTTPLVDIEAEPPQPVITSNLGGSNGQAYDPLSGNYTTSATDAAVQAVGPALEIDRTYNSMDPRASEAFGTGWATVVDTSLDDEGSTVLVTLPDGQEMRFGKNGDGSYAPPFGSPDALVKSSSGTWTLRDSGNRYAFNTSGQLTSITDQEGDAQDFSYNSADEVSAVTDAVSGRSLTLTWSTPTGAQYPHVATVTTPAPSSGTSGYMWTYSYTGDELTQVCAPASAGSGCTSYTSGSGSHYYDSVLDASPRVYYQLGDASGATSATDEVDANLGTANGTYHNVTLGTAGPLAGSTETTGSFNGTSSYVSLPNDLITDSTDVSVGLWFKAASGSSGVLFSYDTDAITNSSGTSAHRDPLLYVGTNGELYAEFWNGSVDPIHTSSSVANGQWHYAVITASSNSQSLYLDGTQVGSALSGQVNQLNMDVDTIGAGFWNSWPSDSSTDASYFDGDIGQVAVYAQPVSAATVASQYSLAENASPELTQVSLPSGNTYESATYHPSDGRLATYTDSDGGQWTIGQPFASGTKSSSDALGYVVESVTVGDPAGRQETYEYDMTDGGHLISYDNGVDPPQEYWYDAAGFLTSTINQDGDLVCLTNDAYGNVLTRTWYDVQTAGEFSPGPGTVPPTCGGSTSSGPDCASNGPCTTFYSYYYDAANPLDPQNDELLTVRDGRSASATDDTYETQYTYNDIGQMTSETTPPTSAFPDGQTTKYAYTEGTETSPDGGLMPSGLLLKKVTPDDGITQYSYDSNGDLAQVTEPSGRYTTYNYDGLGRATSSTVYTSTYPSGETTSYTYTPTGKQSVVTYPAVTNAVTKTAQQLVDIYAYDDDDNLLSLTQSDALGGESSRTTTYTYNDHDEVATVTQPGGATTGGSTQTDGAASADPDGATTAYDYDAFGDVTQQTDPDGNEYRYQYNEYQEQVQEVLYTASANAANSTATCAAPATQDPDGGCDLVLTASTYDPAGLLKATTDAMGRITNYAYDPDQELIESSTTEACSTSTPCTSLSPCTPTAQCTTGSVGVATNYTYDGAGNMISKAVSAQSGGGDGQTTITDYNYNADNELTSEVDDATPSPLPSGASAGSYLNRTTAYTYDANGDVLSKTTGTGDALDVTDYTYDTSGDELSQTVQDGSSSLETTWTYDQNGLPLSMTTPRGNASGATSSDFTTNYTYNPNGNLVTQTGPPVSVSTYAAQTPTTTRPVTTYGYDTFGDQTQVEDPDGNVTTSAYDGDGRITSTAQAAYTPPGASASVTSPTTYAYDENGNLTSVTDPDGDVTSYTYDALGDMTSQIDPQLPGQSAPGTWTYTYDSDGEQLTGTDPLGNETQRTYDYFGNVATQTDALGHTTQYAYDYLGDQTMTDTPDGSVTTSTYDDLGEMTSTTDGAGDESKFDYDNQGNLAHAYNPDGSFTEYAYDEAGNLTSETDYPATVTGEGALPLRSESFGYDADGNQTSATDWDGNTTDYAYNAADELTSQTVPVSSASSETTSYGYDAAGNRTSVTGGNGNTTWTTYNSWNLPESVVEPTVAAAPTTADTTWTTAYNANGEPATVTEPGGVTLSYGYDPLGDITSESGSGASASTPNRSFTYDLDGRMTSAASGNGAADEFTYNADSDLATASGPSGNSSYQYNNDGLVASETDAAGTTSYTYDGADRVSTESDPLTGSTLTWGYNADSNPTSISYSSDGSAGPVESLGYNDLQQLTSQTLTSASGATLASESYGYDSDGNVTSQSTGGQLAASSATFKYDKADQLSSETANGTTTTFGYDGDGNLTTDGNVSNTYNAQDQLMSSTDGSATTTYSYTLNGELASVSPASGSAQSYSFDAYGDLASADGVSYGYDALGRMVSRTDSSGTASVSYLGTSDSIASDGTSDYTYDPSGDLTAEGPASGDAGSGSALMTDVHGDVIGAFSPSSGQSSLAGDSSYSPYGAASTSGSMPSAGYQGDYTDPTTGLVYMNARWYNPATGGFVSSDTVNGTPVPSTVDGNPYAYADGNPLTETDPTGHLVRGGGAGIVIGLGVLAAPEVAIGAGVGADSAAGYGVLSCAFSFGACGGLENTVASTGEQFLSSMLESAEDVSEGLAGDLSQYLEFAWAFDQMGPVSTAEVDPADAEANFQRSSSSGGGGGAGGGGSSTTGPQTCTVECGPTLPPPPPPPPRNCYAAGLCQPTAPSKALKQHFRDTSPVSNGTSYVQLCRLGLCVTERLESAPGVIKGTTPDNSGNPGDAGDPGQDLAELLQDITHIGVQPTPEPEPEPDAGNAASGNNGGSLPVNQGACEPGGGARRGSNAGNSPNINPADIAGMLPAAIDQIARAHGLIAKGPDPTIGRGAYIDPVTGEQRILIHPNASPPHAHVNDPSGQRLDVDGNQVPPESPDAHLPLGGAGC